MKFLNIYIYIALDDKCKNKYSRFDCINEDMMT